MKTFLSAAEIASLQLPGLPDYERGVRRAASRGNWQSRTRVGQGGGLEYAIESLPVEARTAYVSRHIGAIDVPTSIARDAEAEPAAIAIGCSAAQARDARLAILALVDQLASTATLVRKQADRYLCDQYNAGHLQVADWITAEVKSITPRTLARWRALAASGQKSKLAVDRAAARKGTGVLDRANGGEVRNYVLALIAKQPQLTAHHIRDLVADRFPHVTVGDRIEPLPPIRTFQHALKAWRGSYRVEIEAIRNPDGFKSTMRFAARVASPASRLNEVWQIDASPTDVLTTDGRYTLYVCTDVYSRRLIALVTKTPRAAAVGLLIRKAILAWGVPERIKTDNGSDFVARATQRLFAALAIEHEKSAPFSPEQKGHVERAIGTLQRGLMRTLEGFIGHSVADRKVIEGRKAFSARVGESPEDMFEVALSAADLQAHVDNWCKDVYANKPHAGLGGQTPFAVAAMSAGRLREIEDVRALDMLLAPVAGKDGLRTVTKTGLRIDGAHYIGGFLTVGETVLVRMDPADMGRAYVFDRTGELYQGVAVAPELAGIDPAAAAIAARNEQKRRIDERMADVRREARRIKAKDMAPAIHRQALARTGKLVEFPRASDAHETPALAAARQHTQPVVTQHAENVADLAAQLRAEADAPAPVRKLRTEETPHQRWNRARALEDALARNEFVEPDDLLWLGSYREGSEYRGFAMTYGEAQPTAAHESSAASKSSS
ncbi:integrase [Afipia sp. P52-10]|uniref:DDE-type integrase/transposase/recombinase n=1 Tax=Afipia sp. P52-10 TaxID=1429916 RepID=UPI0003DF0AD4|nr:DDE-type integrase/transposase/recombinase [Afipia sp. P52-10]ETR79284.1 integrase [Afipia sp. P52-10]